MMANQPGIPPEQGTASAFRLWRDQLTDAVLEKHTQLMVDLLGGS